MPKAKVTEEDAPDTEVCKEPTGYKQGKRSGKFFKTHSKKKLGFDDAVKKCQAEGGMLAMPKTKEDFDDLKDFVPRNIKEFWLGLKSMRLSSRSRVPPMEVCSFIHILLCAFLATDKALNGQHKGTQKNKKRTSYPRITRELIRG